MLALARTARVMAPRRGYVGQAVHCEEGREPGHWPLRPEANAR